MVRHSHELSIMGLLGERPPCLPDSDSEADAGAGEAPKGKELITPAPEYSTKDRYLAEHEEFARVVILVRFDLKAARFEVRYINIDRGPSYFVLTDDARATVGLARNDQAELLRNMSERLARYDSALATMATLMYLPAFFIAEHARVREATFATELRANRSTSEVHKASKLLGTDALRYTRTVTFLQDPPT